MTLIPEYRKCPKCHKYYSWNPDVGLMFCPNCTQPDVLGILWDKIKKEIKDKKK
jgi:Zn finger protein HypA/HybF involved in hydrogenase expression